MRHHDKVQRDKGADAQYRALGGDLGRGSWEWILRSWEWVLGVDLEILGVGLGSGSWDLGSGSWEWILGSWKWILGVDLGREILGARAQALL